MSEKFLSESEKLSKRGETATELVRGGANLISEKELDGLRIEVTEEQIEEARKEMEEYFGIIEKEAEIEIRAGVEVEKVFKNLIRNMRGEGSGGITRDLITLAIMSGAEKRLTLRQLRALNSKDKASNPEIKDNSPFREISDTEILEMLEEKVYNIELAKKRIYKWIKGVEIPIVGWDDEDKGGRATPVLLTIDDVESDTDNIHGPKVRGIIKQMFDYQSCLQVQYPNGKTDCPNCARWQGRIPGGYLQEDPLR